MIIIKKLCKRIKKELCKHSEEDFYSVDIINVADEDEKAKGEECNIVVSDTYSRKNFEPMLKSFFSNFNLEKKTENKEGK